MKYILSPHIALRSWQAKYKITIKESNKMNFTPEQITKAKTANSVEELLAIAKENGMELSEEEANKYYADFHKEDELSDEELDNVSGGGCQPNVSIFDIDHSHCHNFVHISTGKTLYDVGSKYSKCGVCKYLKCADGKGNYCNDYDTTKHIS